MSELADLIKQELALLDRFSALLTHEQEILRTGKVDELPGITRNKAPLIEALNQATHTRLQHLARLGITGDASGQEAWATRNPNERATSKLWSSLLTQASAVRHQNDLNGQLVKQQLQATNDALAILGSAAQQNALYGPGGQAMNYAGRRIIDSA